MATEEELKPFVQKDSIVRSIWGSADTVLFIFAGAAAEFALNKAVDWLYFTGKLPADPLGRLFSTIAYARKIVFSPAHIAHEAIDAIRAIHTAVEKSRGSSIPDWAYRDVLFMLIHYSIAAHELFRQQLTPAQKQDVYEVFRRMGTRMELKDLPLDYAAWLPARQEHLDRDLQKSSFTEDLFLQYRKHLGRLRYHILLDGQKLVVPPEVRRELGLRKHAALSMLLPAYRLLKKAGLDRPLKAMLLPGKYAREIAALDRAPAKF